MSRGLGDDIHDCAARRHMLGSQRRKAQRTLQVDIDGLVKQFLGDA